MERSVTHLDALRACASAVAISDQAAAAVDALDHVITYDKPMVAAAEAAGLRTVSPS
jgi:hypothetical protein